ncbi:MAG TPA: TonB-dependent receptor [Candidatus Sulfotelmatobacter sp.]|nr:TonB-dependent receptor [Candidatus Sulfotelmatobacter sp.]
MGYHWQRCVLSAGLITIAFATLLSTRLHGQTASSGALAGVTLDPSGAELPGVVLRITHRETGRTESETSDEHGRFTFLLLPPGTYQLQANKTAFDSLNLTELHIALTETLRLELRLQLAAHFERATVSSEPLMVQTDTAALGRVVSENSVSGLPLVTRNFAQITGLSPGVTVGVYNAGELGLGGTALSQIAKSNDGIFVHGGRSYDNNFQIDGISVSDVQGSAGGSGGIPVPNPDSILEFKVQTGLYDAVYGRYAGANVSLITKTGGNDFHGAVFEFFRNEALNANDFFLNQTRQPRPALKENQFGFAFGGPIKKEKLLFFGSYQGTRQINGVAAGQSRTACTASLIEPPLTNDRSPAALGSLFSGMAGALGGVAIKGNGSNINPVALSLLNLKLPNGSFLIPTPQTVDTSKPFAQQGFSVFTEPCHFNEDQFLTNLDYLTSPNTKIAVRFFLADDDETVTFPGNGLNPAGNIPGFPSPAESGFRVLSIAHTHTFRNGWLNEAQFAYVRTRTITEAQTPFKWSDVGAAEGEMNFNNELPSLKIAGSVSVASGFPRTITQNSFVLGDGLSFVHGAHTLRLGGSITRLQDNVDIIGLGSFAQFLSWPDFLLGLNAQSNGTEFSNVFASFDDFGLTYRAYRVWEGTGFAQDDYRIGKSLTLNTGLRYERLGQFGDNLGRNSSFDLSKTDANPPPGGSVAGYLVASNFRGPPPPGVTQVNNQFGNYGEGQNTIAPRIGFAWQFLPGASALVLRGGYGIYYSRPTGQAFYQNVFGAPYSEFRLNSGQANADATFQAPFAQPFPTPESFPMFPAYSPSTSTTIYGVAPGFRPTMVQQYSLNVQSELHEGWLLEVGYVGTRGMHLVRQRSGNQALLASASNPIRGVTTDTVANIPLRVPVLGVPPDSLVLMESEGSSWYNGLEVSLTKRLSHGLQLLASYTFSKTLDTDGADINSTASGNALTLGDQNSPSQRWGRASFDRTHRFVLSGTWTLPSPRDRLWRALFGGWELAGVITIQSGSALTIADTNANNVYGISEDRAQLSRNCTKNQLVASGSIGSKLNSYFNTSCFTTPPVISVDGIGTGFGNSGTGIVNGPGQANADIAFSKMMPIKWPREGASLQFRTELYNALNHPQFANPDTNFSSPTFGVISSTAVNPRVIQLALKLLF